MREVHWAGLDGIVAGAGDGPIVVLVHGFGAPGDDLVPLAHEIDAPPGTRFVFPAAPLSLGPDSRAWWMIDMERIFRDRAAGRPRQLSETPPDGLDPARDWLDGFLDETQRQLGDAPLVLGGFSQGAMLTCDLTLRTSRKVAGLALMSGSFLTPTEWRALMPARRALPILQSHGTHDPMLPFAHAQLLHEAWLAAGATVDWIEFPGGHEIPRPVLAGLASLIGHI